MIEVKVLRVDRRRAQDRPVAQARGMGRGSRGRGAADAGRRRRAAAAIDRRPNSRAASATAAARCSSTRSPAEPAASRYPRTNRQNRQKPPASAVAARTGRAPAVRIAPDRTPALSLATVASLRHVITLTTAIARDPAGFLAAGSFFSALVRNVATFAPSSSRRRLVAETPQPASIVVCD